MAENDFRVHKRNLRCSLFSHCVCELLLHFMFIVYNFSIKIVMFFFVGLVSTAMNGLLCPTKVNTEKYNKHVPWVLCSRNCCHTKKLANYLPSKFICTLFWIYECVCIRQHNCTHSTFSFPIGNSLLFITSYWMVA